MPIITWLSDFGSVSGYPAAMKGVALEVCPTATFVDISHDVEQHDIREGAFLLWMIAPYFPANTVHCAVVDPGVGTGRNGVVFQAGGQFFVGPDNGLLFPVAERLGEPAVHSIRNSAFFRTPVSKTFHGRDIFAPVAAHIASGVSLDEIGPAVVEWVKLSFGEGVQRGHVLDGEVVFIDSFGNVVTNLPGRFLRDSKDGPLVVEVGRKSASTRFVRTYGEATPNELVVTVGSHGQIELAVNQGSAARRLRTRPGEIIRIRQA